MPTKKRKSGGNDPERKSRRNKKVPVGKYTITQSGPFTKLQQLHRRNNYKYNPSVFSSKNLLTTQDVMHVLNLLERKKFKKGMGKSNKSKKKGKGESRDSLDSLELSPLGKLVDVSDKEFEKKLSEKFPEYSFSKPLAKEQVKRAAKKFEGEETAEALKLQKILDGYNLLLEKEKKELLKELEKSLKDVKI